MKALRSLLLAAALMAGLSPAVAQQYPTVPSGTVIGRTQIGTGPAQAIPFSQLIALLLQSTPTIPTLNTNSIVFAGSVSGQATVSAQAAAGTPIIKWPTTSGTVPSQATTPIVLDPVTGIISCPTCSTSSASSPILTSRALAQTFNLSSFTGLVTVGYAAGGDGGGATFKNVGSAPYRDSQIATGSITAAGSAYTNGTYLGVLLSGGTGRGAQANITVAGGVVTVVTIVGNKGNAYTALDVLTTAAANIGGTGSGFTWTVATVTTATCSFTDSVGTHFQMVVGQGNYLNIRQCGAAMNWTSALGDAGSTNDTTAIQNALNFAGDTVQPTVDGGGVAGQTVLVPFGNTLSDALVVPFGVTLTGHNMWSSQIKFTDAMGAAVIPLTLCDSTIHLACFGTRVMNLTLKGGSGTANSNVPMLFSNNIQQAVVAWRVAFYPGQRGCTLYDTGFGGAAQVGFVEIECTMSSIGSPGFNFTNVGTTLIYLHNVNAEFGGAGVSANGFQAVGGFFDIDNYHTEGVSTGIFLNNTGSTSTGAFRLHNLSGGAHCTNLVLKQGGSVASDVIVGMAVPNGCTNTVNNGGSNTTTPIVVDTLF